MGDVSSRSGMVWMKLMLGGRHRRVVRRSRSLAWAMLTYSAIQIIDELSKAYTERGVGLHFAHLRPAQVRLFQLVGITDLVRAVLT